MKKRVLHIVFCVCIAFGSIAQVPALDRYGNEEDKFTHEYIDAIFATYSRTNTQLISEFSRSFEKNLLQLKRKLERSSNEEQALQNIFYSIHRKNLKRYRQYTSFLEMAETKRYDCLSASTLYAMYLRALGYRVNIVETQYHVYLKVLTGHAEIILETTDPLEGYISNVEAFESRKKSLAVEAGGIGGVSSNQSNLYDSTINESVSVRELVGLHYFNKAVDLWNKHDTEAAKQAVSIALEYYPSNRIQDLDALFKELHPAPFLANRRTK